MIGGLVFGPLVEAAGTMQVRQHGEDGIASHGRGEAATLGDRIEPLGDHAIDISIDDPGQRKLARIKSEALQHQPHEGVVLDTRGGHR